jgi:hypothetical protein
LPDGWVRFASTGGEPGARKWFGDLQAWVERVSGTEDGLVASCEDADGQSAQRALNASAAADVEVAALRKRLAEISGQAA